MEKRKFRILALDGGGIRGVISAKILERVREKVGQPLNEYFDLIAGTSTGSILAACLVLGKEPESLIELYKKHGEEIFQDNFFRQKIGYWFKQPKYSNEGLKKVLQAYFGDLTLEKVREESIRQNPNSNPKARLLILAYSTTQRFTSFFLSPFVDEKPWYQKAKLWEVCLSSSAAPTFFPPYKFDMDREYPEEAEEYTFVDGGVAANNPSLGALVHALDLEKIDGERLKLEDISLLSIGTGRTTKPLEFSQVNSWGALNWASQIPEVFMGGQFQITADLCAQLIRSLNPNGYLRIQFEMNQRYQDPGKDSEELIRLPKDQQVNRYTKTRLDEAMDCADSVHIQNLIEATEAFLNSTDCYRKIDDRECSVDRAIEHFIQANT